MTKVLSFSFRLRRGSDIYTMCVAIGSEEGEETFFYGLGLLLRSQCGLEVVADEEGKDEEHND